LFGGGLLAVLLLTELLDRFQPEASFNTNGWALTDFLEHLNQHGVHLRAVWNCTDRGVFDDVYLTEDLEATRDAMQRKVLQVQCLDQWHGTVRVGYAVSESTVDYDLVSWGENGCKIGRFLLFGDERLVRQIQEACR
jgi:hypothetical protein